MAKKKSSRAPSRSSGRGKGKDTGFEVEDSQDEAEAGPMPASLETGLVFVTFVALVIGLILAQLDLGSTYGQGLFG